MELRTLSPALVELAEAAQWLDGRRLGLGDQFWHECDRTLAEIERSPQMYPTSEFATGDADLRFAMVAKFCYVIHFLIEPTETVVCAVAHPARRPGYWLTRVRS